MRRRALLVGSDPSAGQRRDFTIWPSQTSSMWTVVKQLKEGRIFHYLDIRQHKSVPLLDARHHRREYAVIKSPPSSTSLHPSTYPTPCTAFLLAFSALIPFDRTAHFRCLRASRTLGQRRIESSIALARPGTDKSSALLPFSLPRATCSGAKLQDDIILNHAPSAVYAGARPSRLSPLRRL